MFQCLATPVLASPSPAVVGAAPFRAIGQGCSRREGPRSSAARFGSMRLLRSSRSRPGPTEYWQELKLDMAPSRDRGLLTRGPNASCGSLAIDWLKSSASASQWARRRVVSATRLRVHRAAATARSAAARRKRPALIQCAGFTGQNTPRLRPLFTTRSSPPTIFRSTIATRFSPRTEAGNVSRSPSRRTSADDRSVSNSPFDANRARRWREPIPGRRRPAAAAPMRRRAARPTRGVRASWESARSPARRMPYWNARMPSTGATAISARGEWFARRQRFLASDALRAWLPGAACWIMAMSSPR